MEEITPLPHPHVPLVALSGATLQWGAPQRPFATLPGPRYTNKVPAYVVGALGYAGKQRWIALYRSPAGLAIEDGARIHLLEDGSTDGPLARFEAMVASYPFAEGCRGYRLGDGETVPEYLDVLLIDRETGDVYLMPRHEAQYILAERLDQESPAEVDSGMVGSLFWMWLQGQRELFPPLYREP